MDLEQILYMILAQKKVNMEEVFPGMENTEVNLIQFDEPLDIPIFMNNAVAQGIENYLIT